jgi:hypothetical protein
MFNNFNIGDRVGAIQSADKETVRLYGYGTYRAEQDHINHVRLIEKVIDYYEYPKIKSNAVAKAAR